MSEPVKQDGKPKQGKQMGRFGGFRLVTPLQISGNKFLRKRAQHALVRRDPRMIDDVQQHQSGPLVLGTILMIVGFVGTLGWSLISPGGLDKNAKIVEDKDTSALYVRIGSKENSTLNPVLNMTSARLIAGAPLNPVRASGVEIAKTPRGNLVGIPGAPGAIQDSDDPLSVWTVCDVTATGSAVPLDPVSGLPTTAIAPVTTTVIGGPITQGDETSLLSGNQARLVGFDDQTWLIYARPDGATVRAAVRVTEPVVADALGLRADDLVLPISSGLFNAIPAEPPLVAPPIVDVGASPGFASPRPLAVGTVIKVTDLGGKVTFYAVVKDGVQEVGQVAATMIRAANPQVSAEPVAVSPDVLASYPKVHALSVGHYPAGRVQLVSPVREPVTCWSWSHNGNDPTSKSDIVVGRSLPLTPKQIASRVQLVASLNPRLKGLVADYSYMPTTTGRFVESTGSSADSRRRTGYFWITDAGVRWGLDTTNEGGEKTLSSLGLSHPALAPWNAVTLFSPAGETLSPADALQRHDGIARDQIVAGINPKELR